WNLRGWQQNDLRPDIDPERDHGGHAVDVEKWQCCEETFGFFTKSRNPGFAHDAVSQDIRVGNHCALGSARCARGIENQRSVIGRYFIVFKVFASAAEGVGSKGGPGHSIRGSPRERIALRSNRWDRYAHKQLHASRHSVSYID